MSLADHSVCDWLASVVLLQVVACVGWWAWRSLSESCSRPGDSLGTWHYDPRHGQYLPGDHQNSTSVTHHEP